MQFENENNANSWETLIIRVRGQGQRWCIPPFVQHTTSHHRPPAPPQPLVCAAWLVPSQAPGSILCEKSALDCSSSRETDVNRLGKSWLPCRRPLLEVTEQAVPPLPLKISVLHWTRRDRSSAYFLPRFLSAKQLWKAAAPTLEFLTR